MREKAILWILAIVVVFALLVESIEPSVLGMATREVIRTPSRTVTPVRNVGIAPSSARTISVYPPISGNIPKKILTRNNKFTLPNYTAKPVCPEGCMFGGKGVKVQMYNGVITTPFTNFVYPECKVPKTGCYKEGEVVGVKFKKHPYYDSSVAWYMSGMQCVGHVWVPQEGFMTPCPPKLATVP